MAAEYRLFSVTVPALTPIATPQVTSLAMPARIVRAVRVRIPPGPSGLVGWALGAAGVRVIPYNAGAYMVGDDEVIDWPLEGQIDSGGWQLQAYNLGVYPHTLQVSFALDLPQRVGVNPFTQPLDLSA